VADDDDDDDVDDGPTIASEHVAFAALQAARAMYPLSDRAPAPAKGDASTEEEDASPNEAATVTVPKELLDRVRANPNAVLEAHAAKKAPIPAAGRPSSEEEEDEEAQPTKLAPRDVFLRSAKEGQVVIGTDAVGEDATLAVVAGSNDADLMLRGGGMPSALGTDPTVPPPAPAPAFQGPTRTHPSLGQPHGMGMGPGGPMMGHGATMGMPGPAPQQQGPWSSGSSGRLQAAIPHTTGAVQSYPGAPMMQPPQGPGPMQWGPLQASPPPQQQQPRGITGQMILLFVVGFVCLAIFVTGIVLFATTKF
jgi:hypothetical protein